MPQPASRFENLRQHFIDQGFLDIGRPFVLLNWEFVAKGQKEIPQAILSTIGEPLGAIQRAIARPNEVEVFNLSDKELTRFRQGEPLLMGTAHFPFRSKLASGGQNYDDFEKAASLALAVTAKVAAEKWWYLNAIRKGAERSGLARGESAHDDAVEEMIKWRWPEEDRRQSDVGKRQRMRTLIKVGSNRKSWAQYYPSCGDLSAEIQAWSSQFTRRSHQAVQAIDAEISFAKAQLVALNLCVARARELRDIENRISKQALKKRNPEPLPRQSSIVVGNHMPRRFAEVLPAAFAGDIDPSEVFFRLEHDRRHFTLMRKLGRYHRGQHSSFSSDDEVTLKRCQAFVAGANDETLDGDGGLRRFIAHVLKLFPGI